MTAKYPSCQLKVLGASLQPQTIVGFMISGTGRSILIIDSSGFVNCSGYNKLGQLGLGDTKSRSKFTINKQIDDVIAVSAGAVHSLFLRQDGTVWQSGSVSTKFFENIPFQISLPEITQISCGTDHSLFLDSQMIVWVNGNNELGKLGIGAEADIRIDSPVMISTLPPIVSISAGPSHSLFLDVDGSAWVSGGCDPYAMDDQPMVEGMKYIPGRDWATRTPVKIPQVPKVTSIASGDCFIHLIDESGGGWGVGVNTFGQLGIGNFRSTPSHTNQSFT